MRERAPQGDPERILLPDERPSRRVPVSRLRALLGSVGVHVLLALLVVLVYLLLPKAPEPVPQPEVMRISFGEKVKHPALEPVESDVRADQHAEAQSPGPGDPQPHGEDLLRNTTPPAAPGRPEPPPRAAPEPRPRPREPSPREPSPPSDVPSRSAPAEEPTFDEKRDRLAQALGGLGSMGSWGDLAGKPSSGLGTKFGGGEDFQIESTADVDFGPWAMEVKAMVRRNWYSIIPVAAKVGMKGIVRIRFQVLRDGTITEHEILDSSGVPPLDQAVVDALLRLSNPLPDLPSDEDSIRVTYTFFYNFDSDREIREWQRQRWRERRAQGG